MVIATKFGGTSVANGRNLEQVIDIILSNPKRRVNVLSGPGKRDKEDIKLTDLSIGIGNAAYEGQNYMQLLEMVVQRFVDITSYFHINTSFLDPLIASLNNVIKSTPLSKNQYLDGIKPYGEIIISAIAAEALRMKGVDAQVYRPEDIGMMTNSDFGNAKLLDGSYQRIAQVLNPVLERPGKVIIVPGFYGVDSNGRYVTFQRGGSDLTGAVLANALDAELCENWTDTDGILRADPRVVDNPEVIKMLTYREAREMAYSGAQVLHPDTLMPLIAKGIPLHVRNTFAPEREGTYIVATKLPTGSVVEGITHKDGFSMVYVEQMGMNEQVGYLSKLTGIFAENGVSIDHLTTSVDSVAIAIDNGNGRLNMVREDIIKSGLVDSPDGINIAYNKSLVCVVGEGMRHTTGVMAKVSSALASQGINIETVFQGPSERNIIFGLEQKDAIKAVRAIYNLYFGKPAM